MQPTRVPSGNPDGNTTKNEPNPDQQTRQEKAARDLEAALADKLGGPK